MQHAQQDKGESEHVPVEQQDYQHEISDQIQESGNEKKADQITSEETAKDELKNNQDDQQDSVKKLDTDKQGQAEGQGLQNEEEKQVVQIDTRTKEDQLLQEVDETEKQPSKRVQKLVKKEYNKTRQINRQLGTAQRLNNDTKQLHKDYKSVMEQSVRIRKGLGHYEQLRRKLIDGIRKDRDGQHEQPGQQQQPGQLGRQ